MDKINQKGAVPVLILFALIGVLGFLGVASIAEFKNPLFGNLYPKPVSQAAISRPIPAPISTPKPTPRPTTGYTTPGYGTPSGR